MLGDFMVAGRRVLTQTLIIAASAMLVALLIASSPSKAMSMGDDLPPVESPSSDPVLNPDAEDSSTDDQPSDDSSSPDEGEQLDQTENDSGLHDGSDDTDPTQDPEEESPSEISDDETTPIQTDEDQSPDEPVNNGATDDSAVQFDMDTEAQPSSVEPEIGIVGKKDYNSKTKKETTLIPTVRKTPFYQNIMDFDRGPGNLMTVKAPADYQHQTAVGHLYTSTICDGTDVADVDKTKANVYVGKIKKDDRGVTSSFTSKPVVPKMKASSHIDKFFGEPITKFLVGMATRLDSTSDLEGIRKKLYDYIKAHPGEHMATLIKEFDLSPGSISHHLNVLEKHRYVISYNDGRYKRYFINYNGYISTLNSDYKPIISVLKNDNSRRIMLLLLAKPMATQYEISRDLDLHPSTIYWHANKLQSTGLLMSHKEGKNIRYAVEDSSLVLKVLGLIGMT